MRTRSTARAQSALPKTEVYIKHGRRHKVDIFFLFCVLSLKHSLKHPVYNTLSYKRVSAEFPTLYLEG